MPSDNGVSLSTRKKGADKPCRDREELEVHIKSDRSQCERRHILCGSNSVTFWKGKTVETGKR